MKELFSSTWYRVAGLKPRLRSHIRVLRQSYRGEMAYILHDRVTCKFHQFNAKGYLLLGLMDGRRTVHDIWDIGLEKLGDQGPTQHDVMQLLSQLNAIDALVADQLPDTAELSQRSVAHGRRQWLQRFTNVLAWRIPLYDPHRLLARLLPVVRPLLSWWGALVWMTIVTVAVILALLHVDELTHDVLDEVLSPHNLVLLWLVFPILKLCHEFGHAAVAKAYGGEIHELGVMLLVFMPVPYVDASSAWALRSKWQRIMVGAAGMAVELFLAALAVVIWVSAEPGLVRMVAYNAMIIAGVTTVLFNANPLMRFDGYYMLMDFLERCPISKPGRRSISAISFSGMGWDIMRRPARRPLQRNGDGLWRMGYQARSIGSWWSPGFCSF
jgi:putative peptide zinc metalloprotease protein